MPATNYTPISLYYSTTSGAVPLAANLVSGELALNLTDGRLYYKDNAGTVQLLSTSTTATGTANGVLYLNGSKVATSGSALVFDGTNLGIGTASPTSYTNFAYATIKGTNGAGIALSNGTGTTYSEIYQNSTGLGIATVSNLPVFFLVNNSEGMRLTSTGLGIGTSSPAAKLDVVGNVYVHSGNFYANTLYGYDSDINISTNSSGSNVIKFSIGAGAGSEKMRIDSSGNLGIGTSSPGYKLDVYGTGAQTVAVRSATSGNPKFYLEAAGANAGFVQYNRSAQALQFSGFDPTVHATLDSSGNLGLGVTPSAWESARRVLQIGAQSAINYTSNNTQLTNNYYANSAGTATYIGTGYAQRYNQDSTGAHVWQIAASGTAGNAITFSQAMTLDASGNLIVGKTSTSISTVGVANLANGGVLSTLAGSTNATSSYNLYSTGAGAYRFYVDMSGTINATSIVITAISDQRLKENVRDIDTGLSAIMSLKPRRFDWKEGKGLDKKNAAGFIAQEFEEVFSASVGTTKAGGDGIEYKNINYEELIPTMVKAIQEQQALIETLRARVAALES